MRAKSVSFERGKDPKDTLEIGNKNLRIFNKMLKNKLWFAPLQPVINGLTEGSIPESDLEKFIERAIIHFDTKKSLSWYDWFIENGNVFWDNQGEVLIITFDMPDNDYFESRRVYCEILRSENWILAAHYTIHSYLKTINEEWEEDRLFHQSNLYYSDDENFKMSSAINQISRVVEDAIKNLD